MATVTVTDTRPKDEYRLHTWTPLLNGDSGSAAEYVLSGDRTIQVFGTFGTGGTIIAQGSIDGTNWFQLRDPGGTLISFTAAGGKSILESTPFVRPSVTGGDGTTSLTALISVRRG